MYTSNIYVICIHQVHYVYKYIYIYIHIYIYIQKIVHKYIYIIISTYDWHMYQIWASPFIHFPAGDPTRGIPPRWAREKRRDSNKNCTLWL